MEQEEDEWTAPLQKFQNFYNINVDDDDDPRKLNITETEGQINVEGPGVEIPFIGQPIKNKKSTVGQRRHRSLPMLDIIGMLLPLTRL
jgi:hypothetical protein